MDNNNFEYGRIAYAAYGVAVNHVAYDGSPLKTFDDLSETIKQGWQAAGEASYSNQCDKKAA